MVVDLGLEFYLLFSLSECGLHELLVESLGRTASDTITHCLIFVKCNLFHRHFARNTPKFILVCRFFFEVLVDVLKRE